MLEHRWQRRRRRARARRRRRAAAPGLARAPGRRGAAPAPRCCRRRCSAARLALVGEALGERAEDARARGAAVHRLLEHLHGCPPADRAALAARLLPGRPDLAALLDEAERRARGPRPRRASSTPAASPRSTSPRRCRAATTCASPAASTGWWSATAAVLAIDFKSHRVVPDAAERMPEGILRQLGAYRAALVPLWPDRPIEVAVLWTRAARLMPVPAALADAAFARAILDLPGARS